MGKVQDKARRRGLLQSASDIAAAVNRRSTSAGAPAPDASLIQVLVIDAVDWGDGKMCDVEVLSGGLGTGQLLQNVVCPTGRLNEGDTTMLIQIDGEQPYLRPIASTASASGGTIETTNNIYIATIWSAGTDVGP